MTGHVTCALCCSAGVARYFLRDRILLTHRNGDIIGNIAELLDRCRDLFDRLDRSLCRLLDRYDVPRDFFGRLAGLGGKALYLLRDDGKAAACLPGAGGLDGCVEREQVRLRRNTADEIADLTNFVDRCRQTLDRVG